MTRAERPAVRAFQAGVGRFGLRAAGNEYASGVVDGVRVAIAFFSEVAIERAEITVALSPPLDLGLRVDRSGGFRGDDDERVQELLGREAASLLAADKVHANDSEIVVEYIPCGSEKLDVEKAFGWVPRLVALAASIKRRRETIRVASALTPFEAGVVALAKEHGFEVLRSPLMVFGNVPEAGVSVAAERKAQGAYVICAHLWLEGERLAGLSIAPHESEYTSADGNLVTTGNAEFDRIFEVCAPNRRAARAVLGARVCASLCDLYSQFPNLSLANGTLQLADIPLDPGKPNMMAEIAERLLAIAPQLASAGGHGPYRSGQGAALEPAPDGSDVADRDGEPTSRPGNRSSAGTGASPTVAGKGANAGLAVVAAVVSLLLAGVRLAQCASRVSSSGRSAQSEDRRAIPPINLNPAPELTCDMECEVALRPIGSTEEVSRASVDGCVPACIAAKTNMPDIDFAGTYRRCNWPCMREARAVDEADRLATDRACHASCVVALSRREEFIPILAKPDESAMPAPTVPAAPSASAGVGRSPTAPRGEASAHAGKLR